MKKKKKNLRHRVASSVPHGFIHASNMNSDFSMILLSDPVAVIMKTKDPIAIVDTRFITLLLVLTPKAG